MKGKLLIMLCCLLVLMAGCSKEPVAVANDIVKSVKITQPKVRVMEETIRYAAEVSPLKVVKIKMLLEPGEVPEVAIGDMVKIGDQLFKGNDLIDVETSKYNQALHLTETTKENLVFIKSNKIQSERKSHLMKVDQSKEKLIKGQQSVVDNQTLYDSGVISLQKLEASKDSIQSLTSAYTQALDTLKEFDRIKSIDMVFQAEKAYQDAVSALDKLEQSLEVSGQQVSQSPVDGVVTNIIFDDESTTKGFIELSESHMYQGSVNVSETIARALSTGEKVYFETDKGRYDGWIDYISGLNSESQNHTIRVTFESNEMMVSKLFVVVEFVIEASKDALTIPSNAILSSKTQEFIYVYQNGMVVKTPIELGIKNKDYSEVISGISIDEKIVVTGQYTIENGESVSLQESEGDKQ